MPLIGHSRQALHLKPPDLDGSTVLLLCQILSCVLSMSTYSCCQEEEDACCALPSHALPEGKRACKRGFIQTRA